MLGPSNIVLRWCLLAVAAPTLVVSAAFAKHYWALELPLTTPKFLQKINLCADQAIVYLPDRVLVGELARCDDGLFAYLMFDYYRSRKALKGAPLVMLRQERTGISEYHILVQLPADLVKGVGQLAELRTMHLTSAVDYNWIPEFAWRDYLRETALVTEAYTEPASQNLATLHEKELQDYLRHFIRFKSLTDPRIYAETDFIPVPLSRREAGLLASDMVTVSRFYNLPLDLLVGIGAMENNYMNVPGDLENTAWKPRPEPGDFVVRRTTRRVLILNNSAGVWQITRQSLRYAHGLYLEDKRNYDLLPERLRPSRQLDVTTLQPEVLTTYAGLLLRDLLDRFDGDAVRAAGAYNGTVERPNFRYAEGVQQVADYARRVIERTADLNRTQNATASVEFAQR